MYVICSEPINIVPVLGKLDVSSNVIVVSLVSNASLSIPAIVVIGFRGNTLVVRVSFTKVTVPELWVNLARFSVNLTSSFCSAVQVVEFWDLNILPRYGCLEINLAESNVVWPILAVYIS